MADRLAVAREARRPVGQVALVLLLADRQAEVRLAALRQCTHSPHCGENSVTTWSPGASERRRPRRPPPRPRRPRGRARSARSRTGRRPRPCTGRCGRRRRPPAARAPRRPWARRGRPPATTSGSPNSSRTAARIFMAANLHGRRAMRRGPARPAMAGPGSVAARAAGPAPKVVRGSSGARCQFHSARSSASSGTSHASASAAARRSSSSGSPMPNTRLAASWARSAAPTCSESAAMSQTPRRPRETRRSMRGALAEPRQGQPLEDPREAALRRPRGIAAEGLRLRARAGRPRPVGADGAARPPRGPKLASSSAGSSPVAHGTRAARIAPGDRLPPAGRDRRSGTRARTPPRGRRSRRPRRGGRAARWPARPDGRPRRRSRRPGARRRRWPSARE